MQSTQQSAGYVLLLVALATAGIIGLEPILGDSVPYLTDAAQVIAKAAKMVPGIRG